jgi:hypothetical protein
MKLDSKVYPKYTQETLYSSRDDMKWCESCGSTIKDAENEI